MPVAQMPTISFAVHRFHRHSVHSSTAVSTAPPGSSLWWCTNSSTASWCRVLLPLTRRVTSSRCSSSTDAAARSSDSPSSRA